MLTVSALSCLLTVARSNALRRRLVRRITPENRHAPHNVVAFVRRQPKATVMPANNPESDNLMCEVFARFSEVVETGLITPRDAVTYLMRHAMAELFAANMAPSKIEATLRTALDGELTSNFFTEELGSEIEPARTVTKKLLTESEAAALCRRSRSWLKAKRLSGQITYIPGRPPMIAASDLEPFIEALKRPSPFARSVSMSLKTSSVETPESIAASARAWGQNRLAKLRRKQRTS